MEQNTWFDPFYIESQLTEEERRIQKNVRDFCNKELRQNVVEKKLIDLDKSDVGPINIYKKINGSLFLCKPNRMHSEFQKTSC